MEKRRYWDSDVFLGWFNNEADKVHKCKGTVTEAEKGQLIIVTSAITLTEVVYLKSKPRLQKSMEGQIRKFFLQKFIHVRNIDRNLAEEARQLIWQYGVRPKDALHLATALKLRMSVFDTFDRDLIDLSNKLGKPTLRIGSPDVPFQEEIDFNDQ